VAASSNTSRIAAVPNMSLKIEDSIIEIGMRIDSKKAWESIENG
jgi:hypothetical protein